MQIFFAQKKSNRFSIHVFPNPAAAAAAGRIEIASRGWIELEKIELETRSTPKPCQCEVGEVIDYLNSTVAVVPRHIWISSSTAAWWCAFVVDRMGELFGLWGEKSSFYVRLEGSISAEQTARASTKLVHLYARGHLINFNITMYFSHYSSLCKHGPTIRRALRWSGGWSIWSFQKHFSSSQSFKFTSLGVHLGATRQKIAALNAPFSRMFSAASTVPIDWAVQYFLNTSTNHSLWLDLPRWQKKRNKKNFQIFARYLETVQIQSLT